MKKHGFTLIEVIVSIVLVSIVMVSLLASLIQIRQTYTVIHENSDVIVYSSSVSRVINNDLAMNNGIRYVSCGTDGQKCDIILGNDDKRTLDIVKKCYVDSSEVNCEDSYDLEHVNIRTTLRYIDITNSANPELVYIRTLSLDRYNKGGNITEKGYNFKDMSASQYDHTQNDTESSLIDQYTTILIKLNNDINEDLSKYDITLHASGRYDYSNLVGKVYTLELNNNGADQPGTTAIDEIFGVGFFAAETEEVHSVSKQIKKINVPVKEGKAFLGYYYQKQGTTQEVKVIDSLGNVQPSSRFFRNNVEYNLDLNPEKDIIIAKWGDCRNGYELDADGMCHPKEFNVTLNKNGGTNGTSNYKVSYNSKVPDITIPYKTAYQFTGYYLGDSKMYHDQDGKGKRLYDEESDSTFLAHYAKCTNDAHVTEWEVNNNCEIKTCESGFHIENNECVGNKYTGTFYYNSNVTSGSLTVATATATCQVQSGTTCTISVPSTVSSSVGKYNSAYKGVTTSTGSMGSSSLTISANTTYYTNYSSALTIYYPNTSGNISSLSNALYRNEYFTSTTAMTNITATANNSTTQATGVTLGSIKGTFAGLNASVNNTSSSAVNSNTIKNSNTTTYYAVTTASENATIHYNSNKTSGSFTDATATTSVTTTYYCSSTSAQNTSHGTTTTVPSAVSGSIGKYNSAYKGISSSSTGITAVTSFTGGSTYYAYYSTKVTNYYYNSNKYDSRTLYRNEYYSSASAMSSRLATSEGSTSNYSSAAGPASSTWAGLSTGKDTTTEYSSIQAAADSDSTTLYTVYTFSVTYAKGSNVSSIGSTSGSCQVTTDSTKCSVTLPTITPNSGYTALGWSTTKDATTGNTAAGSSYELSSTGATLYANTKVSYYDLYVINVNGVNVRYDATMAAGSVVCSINEGRPAANVNNFMTVTVIGEKYETKSNGNRYLWYKIQAPCSTASPTGEYYIYSKCVSSTTYGAGAPNAWHDNDTADYVSNLSLLNHCVEAHN